MSHTPALQIASEPTGTTKDTILRKNLANIAETQEHVHADVSQSTLQKRTGQTTGAENSKTVAEHRRPNTGKPTT